LIDKAVDFAGRLRTSQCEIFLAHLGGAASRRPTDATAYVDRDAEFVMNVHSRWDQAIQDEECVTWARALFNATASDATGGTYVNFLTEDEPGVGWRRVRTELPPAGRAQGQVRSGKPVSREPEYSANGGEGRVMPSQVPLREPVAPATILVVDDDEVVAQLFTRYLRHLGYAVLEATSGDQALAIVQQRQPPIDLALIDAELRGLGGMEGMVVATAVLAEWPGPQLVLVAGRLASAVESLEVHGRPVRVLRKPLDLDELQDVLRVMLPTLLPAEQCETVSPSIVRLTPRPFFSSS
jgi:CheY-like chemotaxis protein